MSGRICLSEDNILESESAFLAASSFRQVCNWGTIAILEFVKAGTVADWVWWLALLKTRSGGRRFNAWQIVLQRCCRMNSWIPFFELFPSAQRLQKGCQPKYILHFLPSKALTSYPHQWFVDRSELIPPPEDHIWDVPRWNPQTTSG
jgi:hypothetical protein